MSKAFPKLLTAIMAVVIGLIPMSGGAEPSSSHGAVRGHIVNTAHETLPGSAYCRVLWDKNRTYEVPAKGTLNFFIANDTGRNGYYDQKTIAEIMGNMAEEIGPECIFAVGDIHHFDGVQSVNDPLWLTNYELIYTHPELMIPWYPVLGNHEYRGNTQAVLDYSDVSHRWEMRVRYYSKSFDKKGTSVRVVMIDTAPLIDRYRNSPDEYPDACRQDMDRELQWLDSVLTVAREDWIVVMGHHPIYAETDKADNERLDLQLRLDPILRRHKVDVYVSGHIHNFQHVRRQDSGIDYVVNSAGALSRKVKPTEGTEFCSPSTGFSVMTADKKNLNIYMIDNKGDVIHTIKRTK